MLLPSRALNFRILQVVDSFKAIAFLLKTRQNRNFGIEKPYLFIPEGFLIPFSSSLRRKKRRESQF